MSCLTCRRLYRLKKNGWSTIGVVADGSDFHAAAVDQTDDIAEVVEFVIIGCATDDFSEREELGGDVGGGVALFRKAGPAPDKLLSGGSGAVSDFDDFCAPVRRVIGENGAVLRGAHCADVARAAI